MKYLEFQVNILRHKLFLFCLIVLGGLFGGRLLASNGMIGSEDSLLLYLMGLNLIESERLLALGEQALAYFSSRTDDTHAILRLEIHKDKLNESPLPGAVYLAVSRVFKTLFAPARQLYPLFLTQTIVIGLYAAVVLSVVAAASIAVFVPRRQFASAFALTVLIFALTELLPIYANFAATILVHDSIPGVLRHTGQLLARPGPQFSPLGFTPRSHFALLMMAVFALRWCRRYGWSYILLFVLSFIHLSISGLTLVILVLVDLFLRPREILRPLCTGVIALSLVLFGFRETMWQVIGNWELPVAFSLLAAVIVSLFFIPGTRRLMISAATPLLKCPSEKLLNHMSRM